MFRPHGVLARAIFQKVQSDQFLEEIDMKQWYQLKCNLPDVFQRKFVAFNEPDNVTMKWLQSAKQNSSKICVQLWHALARSFLQFFMTQTDINGFLRRGSMFILSENQFSHILCAGGLFGNAFNLTKHGEINILDIGAGDGEISVRLAKSVSWICNDAKVHICATETSWAMRQRLKNLNIAVLEDIKSVRNVALIACLNVLDRCHDPYEVLQSIYNALDLNGRVIIALVLPYMHFVEFSSSHLPLRPLMSHWPERANQFSFEDEATILFEILENFGFRVEAWTKAPYLCEGDLKQSFYWLTDLVVVLSKKDKVFA